MVHADAIVGETFFVFSHNFFASKTEISLLLMASSKPTGLDDFEDLEKGV